MSVSDVYALMAIIPLAGIGLLWLILNLTDGPDAMDDAHGDVPEVPRD